MQTGAVRYRGRRLVGLAVAACAAATPAPRCRAQSSWEQGTAGAAVPRHLCIQVDRECGRFLFAAVSVEQPWGLPGVVREEAEISARRRRCCARTRWNRLTASGYGEDLLEGACGTSIGGLPLHVHLVGRYARHFATGFPAATAWGAGWAVSADLLPFLSVEAQRLSPLSRSGSSALPTAGDGWRASACAESGGALVVASLGTTRGGGRCLRLGLLLGAAGRLRFAIGTRPDTGEVSGGLQVGGAVPVAVSWRMHPVLGGSISVGAGVMLR